jgi:hypothetical protein
LLCTYFCNIPSTSLHTALLLPPLLHLAENCVVVAQGEMGHDGVFRVQELGFPGCEKRSELPATAKVSTQQALKPINIINACLARPIPATTSEHSRLLSTACCLISR